MLNHVLLLPFTTWRQASTALLGRHCRATNPIYYTIPRLSKAEAGLEHARQHDLLDSGLQAISKAPFQGSYEMSCSSSTMYARLLIAESLVLDA